MYTLDFHQMILLLQSYLYYSQILTVNQLISGIDQLVAFLDKVALSMLDEEQKEKVVTAICPDQPSASLCMKLLQKFLMKNGMIRCLQRRCPNYCFKPHGDDVLRELLEEKSFPPL